MPLLLEQITAEINAEGFALAKAIREEMNGRDDVAIAIVSSYEGALKGSPEAEKTVIELYDAWRFAHASIVAPIAANLRHELPGGVAANGAPAETPAPESPFSGLESAPAPRDEVVAAPEPQTPAPAAPTASEASKRARRAWTQSDIRDLTKALMLAPKDEHPGIIAALATQFNREPLEVQTKGAELQLTEGPTPAAKYELSETDGRVLRARVLALVAAELPIEVKIAQFKYCAAELREIVKAITE